MSSVVICGQGLWEKFKHIVFGPAKLPSTQHYDSATSAGGRAYDHSTNVSNQCPSCSPDAPPCLCSAPFCAVLATLTVVVLQHDQSALLANIAGHVPWARCCVLCLGFALAD